MASIPRPKGDRSETSVPTEMASVPPQTPMLDHSFTLQAIMELKGSFGVLLTKTDRLISDVKDQGEKIDQLRHQVTFVRGALWVVGAILVAAIGLATWYLSGRISITLKP